MNSPELDMPVELFFDETLHRRSDRIPLEKSNHSLDFAHPRARVLVACAKFLQ